MLLTAAISQKIAMLCTHEDVIVLFSQAPVAALGMWLVPPLLRPLGISLMTITIHLLGDVPSPPLLGLLQSKLAEGKTPADAASQWRLSMSLISLLLLFSGGLFSWAAFIATPAADFRSRIGMEGVGSDDKDDGTSASLITPSPSSPDSMLDALIDERELKSGVP